MEQPLIIRIARAKSRSIRFAYTEIMQKYAVMLNELFTVICILTGVDSSEDLSSSNYFSTFADYSDNADENATTIIPVIDVNGEINKKVLSPTDRTFTVIGSILSLLTVITACCTFYHEFYKTKSTVYHGGNSEKN